MSRLVARREVLKSATFAAAALLAGTLQAFARGGEGQSITVTCTGSALPDALDRMNKDARPGVVLVVPADQEQFATWASALMGLLFTSDDATLHRLMVEAVYCCVPEKEATEAFTERKPEWNVLLLGVDGNLVTGDALPPAELNEKFVSTVKTLVRGENGERVEPLATLQRKLLGKRASAAADEAIKKLGAAKAEDREAATKELEEIAHRSTALLLQAHDDATDPEVAARIDAVLDHLFVTAPPDKPGPRLPYGIQWQEVYRDPCLGCGMGYLPDKSRRFLGLLRTANV